MNNKARSFVTVMIIIAVVAFLLRFGIGSLISFGISQNESYASVTLKLVSAALENYAKDNQGLYPTHFKALTQSEPPYLDRDYTRLPSVRGYFYTCPRIEASGYSCEAIPVRCKLTGNSVYTITTGGLLVSETCELKES